MFDFGKNWQDFSLRALDEERLAKARDSLISLLDRPNLSGKRFLDVGCGTGLFSIAAASLHAQLIIGIDVDPLCIEISRQNAPRLAIDTQNTPEFRIVNVLDDESMADLGEFDIVYAWGSLHHTGDMYRAIKIAAKCVALDGTFVLAIYNAHTTSPVWWHIKRIYNNVPPIAQRMMIFVFGIAIYIAKFAVTFDNPLNARRGMDFWVDVVDWVGGFPYQYGTSHEIETYVTALGLSHLKTVPPMTPTGCNEFVFVKNAHSTH